MRIVFIGCVQFSHTTLKHLIALDEAAVVGVITRKASPFNADFQSLKTLASEANIPYFLAERTNERAMATWLKNIKPDVVYCFGWPHLLKKEILEIPRLGVIGYHPTALPKNRGRHPIIWALALGLQETGSTFFFMDEGADSGDILSQRKVAIVPTDDANSLYRKLTGIALEQIIEFNAQLISGTYNRTRQDHAKANYWRKRDKRDGQIDWRMSAVCIHNLVRALSLPYPGARCIYDNEEVKIWKTELLTWHGETVNKYEPGKVLGVEALQIIVKCGEGVLKIIEHTFSKIPDQWSYL